MGKKRLLAETGAGQHGVATATVAAALGMSCTIFMGAKDMERQAPNVVRMRLLGADVQAVHAGSCTLKDATNEALRQWIREARDAYYLIGSALGPHPYPTLVREFQKVIGEEARGQIMAQYGRLPDELVACVGGGSNAIGFFSAFLQDTGVAMTGVEAGGLGIRPGEHAARFAGGRLGILQGTKTFLLQDDHGQILPTHSISAGLDYPAVGPEHASLHDEKRVQYTVATDEEALSAAYEVTKQEGILPALESAHALAYALKRAPQMAKGTCLVVNLSGRGDKDLATLSQHLGDFS
jgi:tryptophan synthase beta chain